MVKIAFCLFAAVCAAGVSLAADGVRSASWRVEVDGRPVRLETSRAHDGGSYQFASFDVVGGEPVRESSPDVRVGPFATASFPKP